MARAMMLWYYAYTGKKPAKSCAMANTFTLSIPLPDSNLTKNSITSLTKDILLATGHPKIPSISNPADNELQKTCPYGLSIAAGIFTKNSAA